MSLYNVQTVLAHLCTNSALLKEYEENPANVLSRYDLTEKERDQVLGASKVRLAAYAQMLRSKRLTHVAAMLPLTWKLVKPHLPDFAGRYCLEYQVTPDPVNAVFKEATLFHAFLVRMIDEEKLLQVPYLRQIVEYEIEKVRLSFSLPIAEATPTFHDLVRSISAEDAAIHIDNLYPKGGPHFKILQFDYDLTAVIRWLESEAADEAHPAPRLSYLLLAKHLDTYSVKTIKISQFLVQLLAFCDGRRSVSEIAVLLAAGEPTLLEHSRAGLLQLHRGQVIALLSEPAAS